MKDFYRFLCILPLVTALLGCSSSPTSSGNGEISNGGNARGTLQIRLGTQPGDTVEGTVRVILDTTSLSVPVNGIISSDSLILVDYDFTGMEPGRDALIYISDVSVNGNDTTVAGYAVVEIIEDCTTTVGVTEVTSIAASHTFAATGAAQIDTFYAADDTVMLPNVALHGTVLNMDLGQVFVYVNGNVFPILVTPSAAGSSTFSKVVTLDIGANQIFLMAVNSSGSIVTSPMITVYCNLSISDKGILGTLIWDKPTSDMDLHLWYYSSSVPDLGTKANAHCYYGSSHKQILWDSAASSYRGILDVDDTQGEGPEHITIGNFPDGYYIFAVNSYDLDYDSLARCDFTLNLGSTQRARSHTFTTDNGMSYTSTMTAWFRCYDVKVMNGHATVLEPDTSFVYASALSKSLASEPARKK